MNKPNDNLNSQIENQLREAAEAADRGEENLPAVNLSTTGNQEPATGDEGDQTGSENVISQDNKETAQSESDKPETKAEQKNEDKPEDTKGESEEADKASKYEKAKANKALRQNLQEWQQKINEEKKALEAEKKALAREREELLKKGKKADDFGLDPNDPLSKYTAEELESAAKDFEAEGRDDLAKQARATAQKIKRAEQAKSLEVKGEQDKTKLEQEFWDEADKVIEDNPELKDATKGVGAEVKALLSGTAAFDVKGVDPKDISQIIRSHPKGFALAHSLARLRSAAASVSGLQAKIAEQTKEIERLNKLTSLTGGQPTSRSSPKSFDNMTMAEQEAELRRLSQEMDQFA